PRRGAPPPADQLACHPRRRPYGLSSLSGDGSRVDYHRVVPTLGSFSFDRLIEDGARQGAVRLSAHSRLRPPSRKERDEPCQRMTHCSATGCGCSTSPPARV